MKFTLALKQNKNALISLGLSIAGFLFLWLVWIIAYYAVRNELLFASVGDTFSALAKLLFTGGALARSFWQSFGETFLRTLVAFIISCVCGIGFASLAVSFRGVRAFLAPVISVLRTLPTLAITLFLILWAGKSFAPVLVAVFVLFPAVYAAALASFTDAVTRFSDFAKAYKIGRAKRIFSLYLPVSLPALLTEGGGILSMGLKITVSGEVLAATAQSLGGMMQEAKMFLNMPTLMALTLLSVLVGFLLEGLGLLCYRLAVRWRR